MPARAVSEPRLRIASGLPERGGNHSIGMEPTTPPPRWLDRIAKAEWRRVLEFNRVRPRWLQHADQVALVCYCVAWSLYRQSAEDVAARGTLVPGRSSADRARGTDGRVKNPSLTTMRAAEEDLFRWARQLGFSPASRASVDVGPIEDDDRSEELFD